MGFYIEVPHNKGKAGHLVELYGAEILDKAPPGFQDSQKDALICVVDNGPWEAAGLIFSSREFQAFSYPDGRPKTWLLMDKQKAWKLAGFSEEYLR